MPAFQQTSRLTSLKIEYDSKNERYILQDDYLLEVLYLRIKNNDFIVCDGGGITNGYKKLVKRFLIDQKIIYE